MYQRINATITQATAIKCNILIKQTFIFVLVQFIDDLPAISFPLWDKSYSVIFNKIIYWNEEKEKKLFFPVESGQYP